MSQVEKVNAGSKFGKTLADWGSIIGIVILVKIGGLAAALGYTAGYYGSPMLFPNAFQSIILRVLAGALGAAVDVGIAILIISNTVS